MMNNAVFPVAPPLRLPISQVQEDGKPIQESPLLVRVEVGKPDGAAGRPAAQELPSPLASSTHLISINICVFLHGTHPHSVHLRLHRPRS